MGFTPGEIADCSRQQGLLSVEIELSASGQCACAACISKTSQPVLSVAEILSVVDQAKKMGARRVILIDSNTGPHPHLQTIISELRKMRMEVELFAADTEITVDFAGFLADSRVNVAMDCSCDACVALDRRSSLEATQASQPENFRTIAAIKNLRQAGYGTPSGPQLAARISVNVDNVEHIPSLWRWARYAGIEPHVQIITPRNGTSALQLLAPNRARQLFEELGQIDQTEFGRTWDIPPSLIGRSCKRHLFAAHVTACGTIFACVGVTIPLGNIRTESLSDILKLSEVVEDIRAFGEKVKEPCRTCSQTTDCYGCRGAAYQMTGDYLAGDQFCWKAENVAIESLPVGVADIVPHGPSIRMVDQLVQLGERRATTCHTVPNDSQWADARGRLDELAYIEMIAQSFACSHGFHLTPRQRETHRGLLLGVSNLVISGESRVGDKLLIEIRKITRFGDFGIVEGEVRHEDGRFIASGQVKIWRPGEETVKAFIP